MLTACATGLGDGLALGEGLGLGDGLEPGDGLGLGDGLLPGDGLGLGEGVAPPRTLIVALALLRASSIRNVPETQKVKEKDWPGSRSPLSRNVWSRSRTRARLLPTFVQLTRVPAFTLSKLGLKDPPPPAIATLLIAVALQVG